VTATQPGTDRSDTSRWSFHVGDQFYADLDRFVGLLAADWPGEDADVLAGAQRLLIQEARLIDEGRFNDWLELFTDDCLYWVPVVPGGGDPRHEVSHAFDDRRRLTDRVYWLRTGLAFCQIPQSRTRRLITNVEALDDPATGARLVRSNMLVTEFRAGTTKLYAGWYGHVLARQGDEWRIRLKQVNLLDSEQGHENLTLVF
jgi:benzoate/toluate 1,2-dioxygenase beta subunit